MPKYISITVAGAVSLGCYEAGVLYEILEAIRQHNTNAATIAAKDFIYIDMATGASAGAMSSAILSQHLLYDGDSLAQADTNPLYLPWVKDVSLDGLLTPIAPTDTGVVGVRSILSPTFIDQISAKYLNPAVVAINKPHPAIDPNRKEFGLGLALSNLNGIDYARDVLTGGDFVYTRYQDEVVRVIERAPKPTDPPLDWERIRQAAVASGAFPFAFAVRELVRPQDDFHYEWSDDPFAFPPTNDKYAYTDGGVFQNEPLGLAKNLVDLIGDEDQSEQRFYLFIAPGARSSTIERPDPADPAAAATVPLSAAKADFWSTTKALLTAIFQQARFHDWIQAEEMNDKINNFNERAVELNAVLAAGTVTPAQLDPASKALNKLLCDQKETDGDGIRLQLKLQFAAEYADLKQKTSQAVADSWIEAIMTLELAADIEDKDEMNIIGITATDAELACDPLFSFGGFFSEAYRQHDYDLGRNKAKAFLRTQLAPVKTPALGPIRCTPGDGIPLDPAISAIAASDSATTAVKALDQAAREKLRDQLRKCIDVVMEQAGVNGAIRIAADEFYIRGKVNDWLGL